MKNIMKYDENEKYDENDEKCGNCCKLMGIMKMWKAPETL